MKEDIKLIVVGKPGLINQEQSILKNTPSQFWTIRSQLQGTKRIVIRTNATQKPKSFDCDLGGRHQVCSYGRQAKMSLNIEKK